MVSYKDNNELYGCFLKPSKNSADPVYHYTSLETLRKILSNDILWRFTSIEDFDDKHEGRKTVEVYYDMTIYSLYKEKEIDKTTYDFLSKIEVSEKEFFFINEDKDRELLVCEEQELFVACFSKNKNDCNLFQEYIKTTEKKGFCIELNNTLLNSIDDYYREYNMNIYYLDIIYAYESLDIIKGFIVKLLSLENGKGFEFLKKYAKPRIVEFLSILRCFIKLNRYTYENERRLLISFPKKVDRKPDYKTPFNISIENGKKHIYVPFENGLISNIYKNENVTDDEYNEIQEMLKNVK